MPKVFHQMNRIFLFGMSEYIVVFDITLLLGPENDKQDTLYYVTFWLNAIGWNGSLSPVVLVGTHKDQVVGSRDANKSNLQLALTNAKIQQAHKIIGDHISSLQVYTENKLKLHMPNQCE